jgi:hypothetical protein
VRYGPKKTVTTVALKALIAQSYIAHPKISRGSSVGLFAIAAFSDSVTSSFEEGFWNVFEGR